MIDLRIGMSWTYTPEDLALALEIAQGQHRNSGSRGSREAGASLDLRLEGALGEIAVARMLGIEPQVRVLKGPSKRADIIHRGEEIEVKAGLALVWRATIRDGALYVAVSGQGVTPGWTTIHHIARGEEIRRRNSYPPSWATPRGRSRDQNYWFGTPQAMRSGLVR